ncbi:MAG: hypothetical protein U5O39_01620 [Gammaproteobacteria bacterium]|nr:hypothetical protein [Gammaproteobacteria bacterium]
MSRLVAEFRRLLHDERQHYITIQSQSNGRHAWGAEDYDRQIRGVLAESQAY